MKKIGIVVILLLALAVRLYRLEVSSHFLSDESRDLVNMHQIWVEKKITLAGPISDDRSHMFSSLTYYLLLPFAVIYDFDPLGPVVGAVFWGMMTFCALWYLAVKINPGWWWITGLALAIWYPLVEISRWAWNPNFLPLWITLGLLSSGLKSGLALGLALHHHFLALIPAVWTLIKKRSLVTLLGFLMAVSPFVIFDLRHPPGLFWRQAVSYGQQTEKMSAKFLFEKAKVSFMGFERLMFTTKDEAILMILGFGLLGLGVWDLRNNRSNLFWLVGWILPILATVKFSAQWHYFLPSVPFFAVWLIGPRKRYGKLLACFIGLVLMVGSVVGLPKLWHQEIWQGNLQLARAATKIMAREIRGQKLVNANLAVLGSPDIYPAGKKYRDLLLVQEVRLKDYVEYEISDNLFVVTLADAKDIQKDPAAELLYFRKGPIAGVWQTGIDNWKVVQINRY
ncbi:hypothetical protein A2397_04105 [Candidatus Amesbacteria bacterium RIFOXYB1_FULL_44_23]|uniref:Glycosyltransferase RgtA/B/C/D-like domain-containing protein n=1 Tax=Candidatus Amesbacteria bacterium RIFOXYB1_FULL_44_23 TaxID=1797263 RepID=A0A1F4ZTM7_9BACT|nr:MAG: hypothetical protein A2397_04105 [Candidatus Amesbacteria bacterium RIFOXYB1_FULL_44_23]